MAGRRLAAVLLAAALLAAGCSGEPAPRKAAPDFAAGRSAPVADPVYPQHGNPAIDVLHYDLDLTWAPATKTLTGRAELTIRAVQALTLISLDFAAGYSLRRVAIDGAAVTPTRHGDKLVLPGRAAADQRFRVVIEYSGVPHSAPMPSNRSESAEGVGLRATADGAAWTMQEPFGAYTWYPCSDQPSDEALYDIRVASAPGWSGVASGSYEGTRDGKTLFRSTAPVATYATTVAFGRYTRTALTGPRGLPISLWSSSPADEPFLTVLRKTPELLTYLEKRYGPYPFRSAGFVLVPALTSTETQELVTFGNRQFAGRAFATAAEDTAVHELAHQWFGDAVTPRDWRDIWLNEAFATYADGQYEIDAGWLTTGQWVASLRQVDATTRARSGPPGHYDRTHFADSNVYVGPALMLHEIRSAIGDDAFFSLARDWVQLHRNTAQDRATFTAFANQHAGRNLTPIIDKWLDSPTTPR